MRFLADVGVSPRVVHHLRSLGHGAVHLREEGLHRLPDPEIFRKAEKEDRVLLTFDLDFAEIVSISGSSTVSVVIFRLENTRTDNVISRLDHALREAGHFLTEGVMVIVEPSRIRLRRLPVGRLPEP